MIHFLTNRLRKNIFPLCITVVAFLVVGTHIASAQGATSNNVLGGISDLFGLNFFDFISQAIAQLVFQLQTVASWLLILAGLMLNFSINLTLHIKQFVDQTPAIFTTWKALRDISGMFIIFFLLYAAIQFIIGYKSPNFNELIKNIVLAGVLINFSFFFAGLGIDASNMVSVQLYNAIAPKSSLNADNLSVSGVGNTAVDGGLSDIFMSSLKIPALYDVTGQRTAAGTASGGSDQLTKAWTQPFYIMLYGITSIMIMVTAAFSFGFAAIMFIVRFVILLFLLAFSPIWFMSFISNDVKKYTGEWLGYYKSMLLIMPVYLLLMYMSLNVLTSQSFFGNPSTASGTQQVTATKGSSALIDTALAQSSSARNYTGTPYGKLIELAINAVLVIFMMNVPLIGAISIGGSATKWLKADNFGAGTLWKKVGSFTGRNTLGYAAAKANQSSAARSIYASAPGVGRYISSGLSKVSSAGFGGGKKAGYTQTLKEKVRSYKEIAEKSNYTSDEARVIASKKMFTDRDAIALRNEHTRLQGELVGQTQELNDLERQLKIEESKSTKDSTKISTIKADIKAAKDLISERKNIIEETKKDIAKKEKELVNKAEKMRQEDIAQRFEKQGDLGKAVASAIRKNKSPADKILDAIKEEKKAEGEDDKKDESKKS